MSLPSLHRLAVAVLIASGCAASAAPQLKVLGVERAHKRDSVVLLVEVVNHAPRPMQLERLQYTFGASGAETSHGEVSLSRTVDPGAAVIVQVPLDLGGTAVATGEKLVLNGQLVAHENAIERRFPVTADLSPTGESADEAPAAEAPADAAAAPAPEAGSDADAELPPFP